MPLHTLEDTDLPVAEWSRLVDAYERSAELRLDDDAFWYRVRVPPLLGAGTRTSVALSLYRIPYPHSGTPGRARWDAARRRLLVSSWRTLRSRRSTSDERLDAFWNVAGLVACAVDILDHYPGRNGFVGFLKTTLASGPRTHLDRLFDDAMPFFYDEVTRDYANRPPDEDSIAAVLRGLKRGVLARAAADAPETARHRRHPASVAPRTVAALRAALGSPSPHKGHGRRMRLV